MSTKISGSKYAVMYGPTTGDKVRLADTSLVIEVEKDYTTYGDEVKFGGGKTIRDGMGQSVKTCSKDGDLDLVITNALIVDSTGIVKADIGIKDGKIAGIGAVFSCHINLSRIILKHHCQCIRTTNTDQCMIDCINRCTKIFLIIIVN